MLARSRIASLSTAALRTLRPASTLVVADHDNAALNPSTLSVITAAKAVGGDITVLVAGGGEKLGDVASAAASADGVTAVVTAEAASLEHPVAEDMSAVVQAAFDAGSFTHVFAPASNAAKNFLPRFAAKLGVAPLSDIMSVEGEDTFTRPMYAGNAIATVKSADAVKVATVRVTTFEKTAAEGGSAAVSSMDAPPPSGLAEFVSEEKTVSDRPDLASASIVVAGGRGLKSGENFETVLYPLATKLGAAVGASRAAVDAGFVPNDMQIGQTGKVVAPDLYVAVGLSGAIQHLAGMKDSKTIVCINKDAEAPIVQVSDYSLIADLFDAVPDMESKL